GRSPGVAGQSYPDLPHRRDRARGLPATRGRTERLRAVHLAKDRYGDGTLHARGVLDTSRADAARMKRYLGYSATQRVPSCRVAELPNDHEPPPREKLPPFLWG